MVGSNSTHLHRYINEIYCYIDKIIFITNNTQKLSLPSNVEVHVLDFRFISIRTTNIFAAILKRNPDAIIHIHQANSFAYHTFRAIKKAQINFKTLLTTWGSDVLILPKKNFLLRYIVKHNLLASDIVTADATYVAQQIKQLQPNVKQIATLLYGIESIPPQLDLSAKENIILSTRLHKQLYNIDKIIISFYKFNAYLHQIGAAPYKLVIAATGPETAALKKLAASFDLQQQYIQFTGNLTFAQLIDYYRKAKFFISIPASDGTSSSLLEAMAFGCLPIVSNLPANLEWVRHTENGIINYTNDSLSNDLIAAYTINSSAYNLILDKNHNTVQEKATFKNQIIKFLDLYKKLNIA